MTKRTILTLLAAVVGFTAVCTARPSHEEAQRAIAHFADSDAMRHAAAGIIVYDLAGDSVIAANQPDLTITTASTMKTVTSAAALEVLGADFRFVTPVLLDGEIDGNKYHGNIIVQGCGDPTLGSQFFKDDYDITGEVVEALRRFGISQVEGRIIVDNTLYDFPAYNGDWCADDLAWNYGMGVHGINYCDNRLKLVFDAHDTQLSNVHFKPEVTGLQVLNRLKHGHGKDDLNLLLEYGTPAIIVAGSAADTTYYFTVSNPTPHVLLADSIAHAMENAGIRLKGKALDNGNESLYELTSHRSPVLSDIITSLLERSDNMFAEALLRAVAVHSGKEGKDAVGVEVIDSIFSSKGIDASAKFQCDGSGLARKNKATVRFFAQFLKHYADKRFGDSQLRLVDLMPRVGVNARIGSLLPESGLTGRIAVKSGSMSNVQCYVGYYPADEPEYAFAVLINNWHGSRPEVKNMIDRLLIDVFE